MKHISKDTAKKETKISFRTTDAIFSQLKAISRIENISISFLVENILTNHLIRNENLAIAEEKRQAPRKKCSIPVVLSAGRDAKNHYRGMAFRRSACRLYWRRSQMRVCSGRDFFLFSAFGMILFPFSWIAGCCVWNISMRNV